MNRTATDKGIDLLAFLRATATLRRRRFTYGGERGQGSVERRKPTPAEAPTVTTRALARQGHPGPLRAVCPARTLREITLPRTKRGKLQKTAAYGCRWPPYRITVLRLIRRLHLRTGHGAERLNAVERVLGEGVRCAGSRRGVSHPVPRSTSCRLVALDAPSARP